MPEGLESLLSSSNSPWIAAAVGFFLLVVLMLDALRTKQLTDAERKLWTEAEKKAAEAEREKIRQEHDASRSADGSKWYERWLGK